MFNPDNTKTIDSLIKKYNYIYGAELGVRRGEFTTTLVRDNPLLKMVCVDIWNNDKSLNETHKHDENFKLFIKNAWDYKDRIAILRELTSTAYKKIKDNSLDFIFIDATHTYNALKNDIELWSPKVRSGGIISGHDFHLSFDKGGIIRILIEKYGKPFRYSESVVESGALCVDQYTCWFIKKK